MLTRLGRFTVRRHRLVLSLTVLFMIVAAVLGTRAFGVLQDDGFADPSSESARADRRPRCALRHAPSRTPSLVATSATRRRRRPGRRPPPPSASPTTSGAVPDVADVSSYW